MLQNLDTALDALAEARGTPAGKPRIGANKGGAELLLRDVVPRFLSRYPNVELDLVSDGLVDIVATGFDAGVRLFEDVPQNMIAVRFGGDVRFVTVASPAYLACRTIPATPDDLCLHRCIRHRLPSGKRYRWEFSKHGEEILVDVPGPLTLDDNLLMVQAAADGLGIAYVPEAFAQKGLKSGRLVSSLQIGVLLYQASPFTFPGIVILPSALRAFIDMLK